jgi:hypothetical protein
MMKSPSNNGASGCSGPVADPGRRRDWHYGRRHRHQSSLHHAEAFGLGGLPLGEATILGVLSLVFWALLVVVTFSTSP